MIREGFEQLKPAEWTAQEAYSHLSTTFDHAARYWPDVMERYVVMLADENNTMKRMNIMRMGLRETVAARYAEPA